MTTSQVIIVGVLTTALLVGCQKSDEAIADAGRAVRSPAYDSLRTSAAAVDPSTFTAGDVTLAKGRTIAPVERHVSVSWAPEEAALIDKGGEYASLFTALASAKSPYCPGNDFATCSGKPWYASEPSAAGVIVYVDRRIARAGSYFSSGSDVARGSAYDGVLQFDAVIVPEKLRVARWWRKIEAPLTTLGASPVTTPKESPEIYDRDMQRLMAGAMPDSDFTSAPWDRAPSVSDAGTSAPSPKTRKK